MKIGALQRFSLIEYPGKICAVVFVQGCNFRCPYCYNRELVDPARFLQPLDETEVFAFLERRRGKIDAVAITGGEPTLQPDLSGFIRRVRDMGYLIKVDSNGSNPEVLEGLIRSHLVDYIAMDIKGPLQKYGKLTGCAVDAEKIRDSFATVMSSGVDYEFRTTVVASQLLSQDLMEIIMMIAGARLYALQRFIPTKTLDEDFMKETTYTDEEFEKLAAGLRPYVSRLVLR